MYFFYKLKCFFFTNLLYCLLPPPRLKYLSRARCEGAGGAPSESSCPWVVCTMLTVTSAAKSNIGHVNVQQQTLCKLTMRLILSN